MARVNGDYVLLGGVRAAALIGCTDLISCNFMLYFSVDIRGKDMLAPCVFLNEIYSFLCLFVINLSIMLRLELHVCIAMSFDMLTSYVVLREIHIYSQCFVFYRSSLYQY